jgi:hypothetical protein
MRSLLAPWQGSLSVVRCVRYFSSPREEVTNTMKKITAPFIALVAMLTVFTGNALAYTDPTGSAVTTFQEDVTDWLTTKGVPLLVALTFLGILIKLAIKYMRRGVRAA